MIHNTRAHWSSRHTLHNNNMSMRSWWSSDDNSPYILNAHVQKNWGSVAIGCWSKEWSGEGYALSSSFHLLLYTDCSQSWSFLTPLSHIASYSANIYLASLPDCLKIICDRGKSQDWRLNTQYSNGYCLLYLEGLPSHCHVFCLVCRSCKNWSVPSLHTIPT